MTIIVLLILAGVSLNAIVGDNGIINNAMSANFLQEMTAVQEAFDTWKVGKKADDLDDISLPTEKIVESNTLEKHKRLMGEVGYYRAWSITGERPTTDVKSDDDSFKSAGSSEIVFYPAGVQDLYYLDNDALGLENNNKKYLIDARNSMIYSLNGGTINGIQVHSLAMLRMIQTGVSDAPQFAEAEASGGSGVFAGSKWLTDKDGHYIDENGNKVEEKDRVINPYGFEIIADATNDNIYKLYNNGELYGKGIKGPLLNTPEEEMEKINPYKWSKLTIPSVIPGYDTQDIQITFGETYSSLDSTIYVIDSNKDLWAWGGNSLNILGLNDFQLKEYTGMEATKLNIGGTYDEKNNIVGSKKVYKVFPTQNATFVVTETNGLYELYASGRNDYGQLGTGEVVSSSDSFKRVEFEFSKDILFIGDVDSFGTVIFTGDERVKNIYYAGSTTGRSKGYASENVKKLFDGGNYIDEKVKEFIEIGNGSLGQKPPVEMVKYCNMSQETTNAFLCIGVNGKAYFYNLFEYNEIDVGDKDGKIVDIDATPVGFCILKKELENGDAEYWGYKATTNQDYVMGIVSNYGEWVLLNDCFPDGIGGDDIEDFNFSFEKGLYFITSDNKLFGCGKNENICMNSAGQGGSKFVEMSIEENR